MNATLLSKPETRALPLGSWRLLLVTAAYVVISAALAQI